MWILHGCSLEAMEQHVSKSAFNSIGCSRYSTGALACIAWHGVRPFGDAASGTRHRMAL